MDNAPAILRLRWSPWGRTMLAREIKRRRGLCRRHGKICYDALECGSLVRLERGGEKQGPGCPGPALPNLLAADFHFHLPPRLFVKRCAGHDPGFFSHGS